MRVFTSDNNYKVNFVDENNVLLGFTNEDDCCAHGGWFLSDKIEDWEADKFKEGEMDFPGWNFDKSYRRDVELPHGCEGGAVRFRLVSGDNEKFLTLYNHQNGYYSRGFDFSVDGVVIYKGAV